MATVSARIDDQLKEDAERVADSIGISLSSAINIFLKKFTAEEGFPFPVKAERPTLYNAVALEDAVRRAVAAPDCAGVPSHFTYYDETSKKPIVVYNQKE